jgi:hypothetical protein
MVQQMRTLAIIPCNTPHPLTDELYHADAQPAEAKTADGKAARLYSGQSMVELASHVTPHVCAVIGDDNSLANQVLTAQLKRFYAPWFFPSDVDVAKTSATDMMGQVAAAIDHMQGRQIEHVLIVWPHQIIILSPEALDQLSSIDALVLPLGFIKGRQSKQKVERLMQAVVTEDNTLRQVATPEAAAASDGLVPFNSVLVAVKLPIDAIQRAIADGVSLEDCVTQHARDLHAAVVDQGHMCY